MKALIIGANGFLGRNIVQKCLIKNWHADCVYRRALHEIPTSCRAVPIQNLKTCGQDYDVVFLTAASIPYGNFNTPSKEMLSANVQLVLDVAERFSDSRLIFASSVSVFGTPPDDGVLHESSPFNSPTLYGLSKLAGEFIVKNTARYGIIRFSSLYGRGMASNTFLPAMVKQAQRDKKLKLYGEGRRQQDYLHVSDAADLCLHAAGAEKNDVYLGAYGKSYSNREVAAIIQAYVQDCLIEYTGVDNSPSYLYNNEYTREALCFSPHYTLEKGIKELFAGD